MIEELKQWFFKEFYGKVVEGLQATLAKLRKKVLFG